MKLLWHDLLFFLGFYMVLTLLYRYVLSMNPMAKEYFELLCVYSSR